MGARPPAGQTEVQQAEQQAADDRHEDENDGIGVPQGAEAILRARTEQHHMQPVRRAAHEGGHKAAHPASEDCERYNSDLAPTHPDTERGKASHWVRDRAEMPPQRRCSGTLGALLRRGLARSNGFRVAVSSGLVRHDTTSLLTGRALAILRCPDQSAGAGWFAENGDVTRLIRTGDELHIESEIGTVMIRNRSRWRSGLEQLNRLDSL